MRRHVKIQSQRNKDTGVMAICGIYDEIRFSQILAKLMLIFKSFPICISIASCEKKLFEIKLVSVL